MRTEGLVKKVKYYNEENGYYILNVKLSKTEDTIVCGYGQNVNKNDYIDVEGEYKESRYGKQFETKIINVVQPTKEEAILEYLSSGIIKGISKKAAKEIVKVWGTESINIIDNNPEVLLKIKGMGQAALTKVINSWKEVKPSNTMLNKLVELGFRNTEAIKIYNTFSKNTYKVFENLYLISSRVKSIDFKRVDEIALLNDIKKDDPKRILNCLDSFLLDEHNGGNCIVDYATLCNKVSRYLKLTFDEIYEQINYGVAYEFFYFYPMGKGYLQHRQVQRAEKNIAVRLHNISKAPFRSETIISKNDMLSDEQRDAVTNCVRSKISVITGGAGVGKTTVLKEVINGFDRIGKSIMLCAPTGKAAQKMTESTGVSAATIHRLLKFNPRDKQFEFNTDNPLSTDVIVIDESSMIDIYLMSHLLNAINDSTQVVFIGDVNQLPSVQAGSILRDLIDSDKFQVSRLTKTFRQSGESSIISNAYDINNGEYNFIQQKDFKFLETKDDEHTLDVIKQIANRSTDIQLLTSQHQGKVGTRNLNIELQSIVNPSEDDSYFKVGDRIMQTVNNYEKNVFNGDCGVISRKVDKVIEVAYDNDMVVTYERGEYSEITLAYCISVHKSQGSEYDTIVIALPHIYSKIIDRSWLYTAVTRAKKNAIIVGSKETMVKGLKFEFSRNRETLLKDMIV